MSKSSTTTKGGLLPNPTPGEILLEEFLKPMDLSQSALAYETSRVTDREAAAVFQWLVDAGMEFHFGKDERRDLTKRQVLQQCKMYVAALRIADQFGCDCIGIQYQQGLKDVLPASDLVEGMLNNGRRPPVRAAHSDRS